MTVRITTVCLGNICRSPIAAAVLAAELADLDVEVDSMGTAGWHVGRGADPRALEALARAGYALDHTARQASAAALAHSDLVLAMDSENADDLRQLGVHAVLIRSFDPAADGVDVPDPYYGSSEDFDDVVTMIQASVAGVRQWLADAAAQA
ncbi:MAG: protein tyrosine phosphatase [Candidatus Nanopelagicales bacterium]|jgi:protein-tyrosine phosphatase|nr:protein tyrosine phosphatase [Candidatus Nanopelagicales bacterium]MCU0295478.1 protein tyrosine phosphatase [Candidatus Nanopelagicales bacterium]MCU0299462.1 protein tyrosine phosphatase [Candidatus Nanopelagicales bacterium]